MKTYKATLTLPIAGGNVEEQELGLAKDKGYQEKIMSVVVSDVGGFEVIDNPQTPEEFINQEVKKLLSNWCSTWANKLVDEYSKPQIDVIVSTLNEQIVKPVIDSITVEVIEE